MYSQTVASVTRNAAVLANGPIRGAPTLQSLFNGHPSDVYLAGAAIFWEGDKAGHIYNVIEGVLRIYRILPDGRRAIIGFIYSGEMLGVSFHDRHLFTAEAVTDVKVRRFSRNRFFAIVDESPELRPQLFSVLCDEMSAAQDQMLLLGRKNAEERVVSFLLSVHRKNSAANAIEVPMSRLDMADYLGLTIETVSRMMTGLTRRGLIAATGRHTIALRRINALREIAGADDDNDGVSGASSSSRQAIWPN